MSAQSSLLAPFVTFFSFIPLAAKMGKSFLLDLYKSYFFPPRSSALSYICRVPIKVNVPCTDGKFLGGCPSDK